MKEFDCIGMGVSPLDFLSVPKKFPKLDEKTETKESLIQGGGPVPTALATLGKLGKKVAFSPFFIPFLMDANSTLPYEMPFIAWYFICSFFSSTLLQHFFGIGFGMGSQLGTKK